MVEASVWALRGPKSKDLCHCARRFYRPKGASLTVQPAAVRHADAVSAITEREGIERVERPSSIYAGRCRPSAWHRCVLPNAVIDRTVGHRTFCSAIALNPVLSVSTVPDNAVRGRSRRTPTHLISECRALTRWFASLGLVPRPLAGAGIPDHCHSQTVCRELFSGNPVG